MEEFEYGPRFAPQLDLPLGIMTALMDAGAEAIRRSRRQAAIARRPRRGATLRPGPHTPLWNVLAGAVRSHLVQRGEKVKLGRIIGLPRQRINDLFRRRHHLPDAERTLLLLVWLHHAQAGQTPAKRLT